MQLYSLAWNIIIDSVIAVVQTLAQKFKFVLVLIARRTEAIIFLSLSSEKIKEIMSLAHDPVINDNHPLCTINILVSAGKYFMSCSSNRFGYTVSAPALFSLFLPCSQCTEPIPTRKSRNTFIPGQSSLLQDATS